MGTHLKPCPFCGGAPELDTRRYYMSLEGRHGTGVAIYCVNNDPHCSADMMLCREDMPEYSTDDIVAALAEQWNRRPNAELSALAARIMADQEPLGAEFEAVWDANTGELYEP